MNKTTPSDHLGEVPTLEDESEKTMPLMAGVARPEGLPDADLAFQSADGGPSRFFNQGTLLILVVFLVAAGSLYAMRTMNSAAASTDSRNSEKRVDKALGDLVRQGRPDTRPSDRPGGPAGTAIDHSLFKDAAAITALLLGDPSQRQVPVEFLKMNPFVLPGSDTPVQPGSAVLVSNSGEPASAARKRQEELARELAQLKVQSVMGGARPLAVINEQMLQVGHRIGSFTVTEINAAMLQVVLAADGQMYPLKMEAKPDRSPGRGGR